MGVFAGRERELAGLRAALDGESRLVLVAGDAGIGKTRFVTEGLRGTPSVWGACLPLAGNLPFLPVTEALDALSRMGDGARLAGALAGQLDEGFAVLRRARALAESGGDGEACLLVDVCESDALVKTARVAEAAEVARRGLASARQTGLDGFWNTAILAGNGAEALLVMGRRAVTCR